MSQLVKNAMKFANVQYLILNWYCPGVVLWGGDNFTNRGFGTTMADPGDGVVGRPLVVNNGCGFPDTSVIYKW